MITLTLYKEINSNKTAENIPTKTIKTNLKRYRSKFVKYQSMNWINIVIFPYTYKEITSSKTATNQPATAIQMERRHNDLSMYRITK